MTGYSPRTGHAEPSWAAAVPLEEGRDLGGRFRQDAIYVVRAGTLFVTACEDEGALVVVGDFEPRVDAVRRGSEGHGQG